jgi:hypothetical protein
MIKTFLLATGVTCGFTLFGLSSAQAQQFPPSLQGEWLAQSPEEERSCKRGDFDKMESDALMKVTARGTAHWESSCRLQGLKETGNTWQVRLVCDGEGMRWQDQQIWSLQKISNRNLLIMVTPKSGFMHVMQKCD